MALWMAQALKWGRIEASLENDQVRFTGGDQAGCVPEFCFKPINQNDAHNQALMLRKAARRLEEIGRGLD